MPRQDEFRRQHPNWKHKPVPFGEPETQRLASLWTTVLESQNGHDVDETPAGVMTGFLRSLGERMKPPGRMLVIGCGTGEEIVEARAMGWQAEGITLAPMNVAWAKEHYGLDLLFQDFHVNGFPTASFDAIVGRQVWEHSWAPFIFAIECARVLKPGGKVALETPCCKDFIYDSATVHHVFCPTPYQGARMLEKAGFVDVATLSGMDGALRPFEDEHRDDVGGSQVVFVGARWSARDANKVNPMVRNMTGGGR